MAAGPVKPVKKWAGIAIYSERGTSAVMLMVDGKPKRFDNYQKANEYINDHQLGSNASPVEVYEE